MSTFSTDDEIEYGKKLRDQAVVPRNQNGKSYYMVETEEFVLEDGRTFYEDQNELLEDNDEIVEILEENRLFRSGDTKTEYKKLKGVMKLNINGEVKNESFFNAYAEGHLPFDPVVNELHSEHIPHFILLNNKSPFRQLSGSSSGMGCPHLLFILKARVHNASMLFRPENADMLSNGEN